MLLSQDLDIIFSKFKKGKSKISFEKFVQTLPKIARKKLFDTDELVEKICSLQGPKYKGTKAQYNKLHDDKANYTGVYKNGGPTNLDSEYDRAYDMGYLYDDKSKL